METFKGIVYFIWLLLFSSSSLVYGEMQNFSSRQKDSKTAFFLENILSPDNWKHKKIYTTNILLAQNEQTGAGRRRANDLARRKQAKRKETKKSVMQPEYESCKNTDLSSMALQKERSSKIMEGGFCFTCFGKNVFGFSEINETTKTLQTKTFKKSFKKE